METALQGPLLLQVRQGPFCGDFFDGWPAKKGGLSETRVCEVFCAGGGEHSRHRRRCLDRRAGDLPEDLLEDLLLVQNLIVVLTWNSCFRFQ